MPQYRKEKYFVRGSHSFLSNPKISKWSSCQELTQIPPYLHSIPPLFDWWLSYKVWKVCSTIQHQRIFDTDFGLVVISSCVLHGGGKVAHRAVHWLALSTHYKIQCGVCMVSLCLHGFPQGAPTCRFIYTHCSFLSDRSFSFFLQFSIRPQIDSWYCCKKWITSWMSARMRGTLVSQFSKNNSLICCSGIDCYILLTSVILVLLLYGSVWASKGMVH